VRETEGIFLDTGRKREHGGGRREGGKEKKAAPANVRLQDGAAFLIGKGGGTIGVRRKNQKRSTRKRNCMVIGTLMKKGGTGKLEVGLKSYCRGKRGELDFSFLKAGLRTRASQGGGSAS